jgi:predicted nucleic acid-binding protein
VTLDVDTSALLKLYVEEAESSACEAYLAGDDDWVTGRHTLVEARRTGGCAPDL